MLLNPKQNSFFFQFPKGFFPEIIVNKYLPYLKKQPIPYDSLTQFAESYWKKYQQATDINSYIKMFT